MFVYYNWGRRNSQLGVIDPIQNGWNGQWLSMYDHVCIGAVLGEIYWYTQNLKGQWYDTSTSSFSIVFFDKNAYQLIHRLTMFTLQFTLKKWDQVEIEKKPRI